jgi:hypothetical protein
MSVTWYCPVCWHHTGEQQTVCPGCGHSLMSHEFETYEERLMKALTHPVREQRMIAIETLGNIRYLPAVPKLELIVRNEEDAYVVCEVIRALMKIGTPECIQIIASLTDHPSVVVREELMKVKCSNPSMQGEKETWNMSHEKIEVQQ